jgi:hypothetical protein
MLPTALTPEKAHPIPTDLLLAGPQNWFGVPLKKRERERERDKSLVPCQESDFPPNRQKLQVILKT